MAPPPSKRRRSSTSTSKDSTRRLSTGSSSRSCAREREHEDDHASPEMVGERGQVGRSDEDDEDDEDENQDDQDEDEDEDDDKEKETVQGVREMRKMEEDLNRSMAIDVGLRKEQKQHRLERDFEKRVRDWERRVNERVDEYQWDIKHTRDTQLSRLLTLTQRKADVETRILQHVRELADAYEVVKEEFDAVVRGRAEDVQVAIETLRTVQEEATTTNETAAPPL